MYLTTDQIVYLRYVRFTLGKFYLRFKKKSTSINSLWPAKNKEMRKKYLWTPLLCIFVLFLLICFLPLKFYQSSKPTSDALFGNYPRSRCVHSYNYKKLLCLTAICVSDISANVNVHYLRHIIYLLIQEKIIKPVIVFRVVEFKKKKY